jgi:hypothetical protein
MDIALEVLGQSLPDVLNHNMETVPRLYKQARPGADYKHSLEFLKQFKARYPKVSTKSGLMVGLGETDEEILEVMRDLRAHDVEMLTIGQYLAPSGHHLPVSALRPSRHLQDVRGTEALKMGFTGAACARWFVQATGPTAGAQRWRRLNTLGITTDCRAGHRADCGPYCSAGHSRLPSSCFSCFATNLNERKLPTACVVIAKTLNRLPCSRQHHHIGATGHHRTGHPAMPFQPANHLDSAKSFFAP